MSTKIVIFGAGAAGDAAYEHLSQDHLVLGFCDNDARKVGTTLRSLPIYSPQSLNKVTFDLVFVASEYTEQITHQLISQMGIPPAKIKTLPASAIKAFHFGDNSSLRLLSEKILIALSDVLSNKNIKHHVDAGTLLGIYRDGELIPWDDDLDFAIPSEETNKVLEHQHSILAALENVTQCKWQISQLISEQDFGAVKKGETRSFKLSAVNQGSSLPLIDLFVKYISGENMDYVISSRGIRMASKHMNQLELHVFKGKSLSIPSKVEDYLSSHYGDWRTPKQDWSLAEIRSATVF